MGGKQKRHRQHVLLFFAACLIFPMMTIGCRTAPRPLVPGPYSPEDRQESQLLDIAELFLEKKDYSGAMNAVREAISCCSGRFSDRAAHLLVIMLSAPDNPMGIRNDVIRCVKTLEVSFPDAVYGPASRCWTAALNEFSARETEIRDLRKTIQSQRKEIRTLERQLEQLKAVDLELQPPKLGDESPHE